MAKEIILVSLLLLLFNKHHIFSVALQNMIPDESPNLLRATELKMKRWSQLPSQIKHITIACLISSSSDEIPTYARNCLFPGFILRLD